MRPDTMRAAYRRLFAALGAQVTLSRGAATATVSGRTRQPRPDELIDVQDQAASKLLLSAEELELAGFPVPPRKGDRVTVGSLTFFVDAVDGTRRIGTVQIAYDLTIVG